MQNTSEPTHRSALGRRGARRSLVFLLLALTIACAGVFTPSAQATQATGPEPGGSGAGTGEDAAADSSAAGGEETDPSAGAATGGAPVSAGEVDVRVAQCGVASAARLGDWFGLQVELQDSAARVRNVVVRLSMRDADGDVAYFERAALPNPGRWESVWLYARLPFNAEASGTLDITVHEVRDETPVDVAGGSAGDAPAPVAARRFEAGRVIGATRFPLQRVMPPHVTTWAIVGDRSAGLEQYSAVRLPKSLGVNEPPPTGHELIECFKPQSLTALPDRWMGWAQFELIAWTGGSSAAASGRDQPSQLSESQASAIKEWVRRGGHLVVVLPPVGQPWLGSGAAGNPLSDIMPTVNVRRVEGVDLADFRDLLTNDPTVTLPRSATVQYLLPNSSTDAYSAMPILAGPYAGEDGGTGDASSAGPSRPVVVRRLVGAGAVTVVGIDVTTPALTEVAGALRGHVFWGRVLGKRMETLTPSEIFRRIDASSGNFPQRTSSVESATSLDAALADRLRMSGESAAGLLLAFVVFLAYWLAAGPLGFFGLKAKGLVRHSWIAFVAATIVFTGIAWGGANLLKGRKVTVRHVTIVDHVFGQTNQRARTWLNIYFPGYGEAEVSTADPAARNTVCTWEAFDSGGLSSSFPDARGYGVDARTSASLAVPVRATAKQFQVDWAGSLGEKWRMPLPDIAAGAGAGGAAGTVADSDAVTIKLGDEIKVVARANAKPRERWWGLQGQLTHQLPAPLSDVVVIVNLGLRDRVVPRVGTFSDCAVASIAEWPAGQTLDLSSSLLFPLELGKGNRIADWLDGRTAMRFRSGLDLSFTAQDQNDLLADIAVYSLFGLSVSNNNEAGWALRRASHGYDVSRWFTQPGIIIIGRLDNVACPVPVTVGGQALPTAQERNTGPVIVRWMYPLPPKPPVAGSRSEGEPAEGEPVPETRPDGPSGPPASEGAGPGF